MIYSTNNISQGLSGTKKKKTKIQKGRTLRRDAAKRQADNAAHGTAARYGSTKLAYAQKNCEQKDTYSPTRKVEHARRATKS